MEQMKKNQSSSNSNIISLNNCRSSDSKSEKKKHNTKLNDISSFDSENYQDSSLEVSNFSNEKLNDIQSKSGKKPEKLSSIAENINDEENSSLMDRNETGSKTHLEELMKSPQQRGEKTINKISCNVNITPKFCYDEKNDQQKTSFTNEENGSIEKRNHPNKDNELEVDDLKIKVMSNQCVCSACQIF